MYPFIVQQILQVAARTLNTSVNDVWLLHGASEAAAQRIATGDFRMPKGAGSFGKGLCTSRTFPRSRTEPNDDGAKVMMFCRVTPSTQ